MISLPGSALALYVRDYFSADEDALLIRIEQGDALQAADYEILIEGHFSEPGDIPATHEEETGDNLLELFGLVLVNGDYQITPQWLHIIRRNVYDEMLFQALESLYVPILTRNFPGYDINLGEWRTHAEKDLQSLHTALRTAWQFTLFEYVHGGSKDRYGDFVSFFVNEFEKRVVSVKKIWESRPAHAEIHYIPLFESFRNYNKEQAQYISEVITGLLNSTDLSLEEKKELERALIKQAEANIKYPDDRAKDIKRTIIEPLVSKLVNFYKAEEFFIAAQKLYDVEQYDSSIDRCYYSMMNALRCLLAHEGKLNSWKPDTLSPAEKHDKLREKLRQLSAESSILAESFATDFDYVKNKRWEADYSDKYFDPETCRICLDKARNFLQEIGRITGLCARQI